jgi:hypothetical protein
MSQRVHGLLTTFGCGGGRSDYGQVKFCFNYLPLSVPNVTFPNTSGYLCLRKVLGTTTRGGIKGGYPNG